MPDQVGDAEPGEEPAPGHQVKHGEEERLGEVILQVQDHPPDELPVDHEHPGKQDELPAWIKYPDSRRRWRP